MFPQDRVVPVGSNTTFCCIVGKGKQLRTIKYDSTVMHPTPLSSRSYSVTAVNQTLSNRAGSNVVCRDTPEAKMNGAVVFVGCKRVYSNVNSCEMGEWAVEGQTEGGRVGH